MCLSIYLFTCLFRSFGQGVVGYFTPLLSFQSHPAPTFPCDGGCPVATGYFCVDPPPSSLHTVQLLHTVNHTSESGAAAFNQTPQNSPRGWVGCRPQQGPEESCVQPCPPMTQTERTGEEWRSSETNRNHLTRWIYYSTGGVTVSASACHMHSL